MYDELIKRLRCQLYGNCQACANWYTEKIEQNLWRERCAAIDAADAIEELQKQLREEKVDNVNLTGWLAEEHAKLDRSEIENIKLKEEFAKYRGKNRWISVTERLPEKDGTFITAYSKGGVSQNWFMTFHHGDGKWHQNSEDTGEVTHWMPLPEPPESDGE